MKTACAVLSVAALGLVLALPAAAQEAKKPDKPAAPAAAPQGMPPLPKPGPEHAILKGEEGTWDATVESWQAPGGPAMTSKGVETNTLMSGMWLVTDFKGEFMAMPFLGHGVAGYDSIKKKYVSTWVDSMSAGMSIGESSYDAASKTLTGWMEGPDIGPDGAAKMTKMKMVTEFKDPDSRVFSMYGPGPDGKEMLGMRITYKRRK